MRICAGIIAWQDGPALDNTIRSLRNVADEVVIADGLIDGVEADGLPPFSDPEHLARFTDHVEQRRWPTQSAQRQWTLEQAKLLGCDWLLAIDADEQLVNGQALRNWLAVWGWDAFPLPFYFHDDRQATPAAFKCLHLPFWRRYVCQGSILENVKGETVQVFGQSWWTNAREAKMPYLLHRPELRPEPRRSIRLSDHETQLEPYPPGVKAWLEPFYVPRLLDAQGFIGAESLAQAAADGLPIFYCPGCGRRYGGPGSCATAHEPIALEPLLVAGPCAA